MSEIVNTWDGIEQPHDEKIAGNPWFYVQSYREFQSGLEELCEELSKYSKYIEELNLESSAFDKETRRLIRMIEWGKERLQKTVEPYDEITIGGVSYGSLRYLKAGALYRAKKLIEKRDEIAKSHKYIPKAVVSAFDERIQQLVNLAEQGVLNGLKPADVFFDVYIEADKKAAHEVVRFVHETSKESYSNLEMPIVDQVLRDRCLKILRAIDEDGSQEKLDTVIREMSVVLEDRIREVSGITDPISGGDLISAAMAKQPSLIKFSERKDLQENAHLLFRGYSGFVRNEAMHRLVPSYTRERVMQLLGFVDYLLFLLTRAESQKTLKSE